MKAFLKLVEIQTKMALPTLGNSATTSECSESNQEKMIN